MTLLKDLIDIPDRVQKGDFVLKLAEDLERPEKVLENYVATPELAKCFDAALGVIKGAVQGRSSKATYLHGSFGSGKSHFMAILHLILQNNPTARGIAELAAVITRHNDWLAGKKFLPVPYHLTNAHDMESGILGGYVEFVRRTHPAAPIPPVYMSAAIIGEAADERSSYGDEPFFKRLNAGLTSSSGGSTGWGELEAAWDAQSFEAAAAAPPDSEQHLRLISTLLKTVATSHAEVISQRGGNFVRFDIGLAIISQHAKSLGYDALVLFLDELILWLAMRSADLGFVKRESAKLTNLVEAQSTNRPIPIVSFVARQRDLRELIGDQVPGAEKLSFGDSLDWQQGRFDTITLEDRNLPAIAQKRVLRCQSQSARDQLDAAFEQTARMKDSVMTILLTHSGDRQMFRQVYPFSPALVNTLIAVSSMLQRERTALKVMMQLLVEQRDVLKLGELIPVGDLFDVVAHGEEAFSPDMAIHFDNAKRLYHQKLLPQLEKQHDVRRDEVENLPYDDTRRAAFRNDDRLVKTLLLSALVPDVESLRGLNAEKLAALNHGTIKTPIPGRESQEVLRRVKIWISGGVGEIHLGEEANPSIHVKLSGVDTDSIIEQARREDNQGNRLRRVRQMLFEQLGISGEGEFEQYHEFWWRNTRRNCEVVFKNIRELPDSSLENTGAEWKLIIDFPFDEGHGPRDDISTIQRFMQSHPQGTKTLCWVPSFFSVEAQKDLGMLVILEHILMGERYGQYANHLSPQDRQAAKALLENQRNALRQRVQFHLDAAYGIETNAAGSVDTTHDLDPNEHYPSLCAGFLPQPPVAANLAGAMHHLLTQTLDHQFPAGPYFETEVKTSVLKRVYELILPATQIPDGRQEIEKLQRALVRQIANPLLLGEMGLDKSHFLLGSHWKAHFTRKAAETGGAMTVAQLRDWINMPRPMGLPREAENLVILLFAAQTNCTLHRYGGPFPDATLQTVPDDCELRADKLPEPQIWEAAVHRAGSIFGLAPSPLLSVHNVNGLAADLKALAESARKPCQGYGKRLKDWLSLFAADVEAPDRLKTAAATLALVERLHAAESTEIVAVLAGATVETSETAMGECRRKAAELEGNLDAAGWDLFEAIEKLTDEREPAARHILAEVAQARCSDEHAVPLATALKGAQARAVSLLTRPVTIAAPVPQIQASVVPLSLQPPVNSGKRIVNQGSERDLSLATAIQKLAELEGNTRDGQSTRISLSWVVEEGGSV